MTSLRPLALSLVFLLVVGCSDDALTLDGGSLDAGGDAQVSSDAGLDGGPGLDGALDAGTSDAGADGGALPVDDPYEPVPALAELNASALATLQGRLDDALAGRAPSGATHSILIVDLETGQELYARDPDALLKPASNTKLCTTAAALDALGVDWSPAFVAYAPTPDDAGSVLSLDVEVDFDPSASTYFFASNDFALERFAEQVYAAGVRRVTSPLVLFGQGLYDAYQYGTYDPATERSQLVSALADALDDAGVTLASGSMQRASFTTTTSRLLARESPPLLVETFHINTVSHNEMADLLCQLLGRELGGEGSYAAGTAAMEDFSADVTGLSGAVFNDGSGLSHDNRVSARHIVNLFRAMLSRPAGERWIARMSLSGTYGTLASRLTGAATGGRFYGKTGTLSGVIATSGVLHHLRDGRRYAFGMLMNSVSDAALARNAHDALITAVAGDLRGVTAPNAPVLRALVDDGDGRLRASWTAVSGAEGYVVEIATDGHTFDDRRFVSGTDYAFVAREAAVRVRARLDGVDSKASDTYAARSEGARRVLLVDANDRWEDDPTPENPAGFNHAFLVEYADALAGLGGWSFASAENDLVRAGTLDLADYDAVIWSLGEESEDHRVFESDERSLLDAYLAAGSGRLIVSGAELGYALSRGSAAEQAFLADSLHASYVADDAGTYVVRAAAGVELGELVFDSPGGMDVLYPDVLDTTDGEVSLRYVGGDHPGGGAAVRYGELVVLGFPIESVDRPGTRAALLGLLLD